MSSISFSQQVKEELVQLDLLTDEESTVWLAAALAASGDFRPKEIAIKSAQLSFIQKLQEVAARVWGAEGEISRKITYATLRFADEMAVHRVKREMLAVLGYNVTRGIINRKAVSLTRPNRFVALRAMFLAAGSMADPEKSYQIEFSLRRQSVTHFLGELLELEEIDLNHQQNGAYHMLYIKNGDQIATLLGGTGAHKALLRFEDTRVRKNMNEMVNRTVNCDNANLQRIADSSARQMDLLQDLNLRGGLKKMPEDLRKVAEVRLAYPGYSIRELGEVMNPPLGKSGMYHRLGKLENWVRHYLLEEDTHGA